MKTSESLAYIIGSASALEKVMAARPVEIFSEKTLDFMEAWSERIKASADKTPSDLTFAFWARRAKLENEKKAYGNGVGKGSCLQFVPNNIPALFAYSLAAGLLAGCSVAMRLPSKHADTRANLMVTLEETLKAFPDMKERIVLFTYPHSKIITDELSSKCDVRIIWGGDSAVSEIQSSPLKEGASEVAFPDRKSLAVLEAGAVLNEKTMESLLRKFFNDTYAVDQNACSSPSLVFWKGTEREIEAARKKFWEGLAGFIEGKYVIPAAAAVRKYREALYVAGNYKNCKIESTDNRLIRVLCKTAGPDLWSHTAPGGLFFEMQGESPESLTGLLTEKCQTVTYFGNLRDELLRMTEGCGQIRVTPLGTALEFDLIWDGKNLIKEMSND